MQLSSRKENPLSREQRLQEGIFFTAPSLVQKIVTQLDYTCVKNVLDSAAGSGNFLIPLAKKYPHIQFYGIEKNRRIYEEVISLHGDLTNLHYYHGDCLLEEFPIPPCDLYLGNPPFINHSDLPVDYREKIQPLWVKYLEIKRDFNLLLGKSRADIAQLIFQVTLQRYLKEDGRFAVVLPDSLLWGKAAQMGFQKSSGFAMEQIVQVPAEEAFEGTDRSSFYLIGQKGEESHYPISYTNNEGQQGEIHLHRGFWKVSLGEGSDKSPAVRQWPENWLGFYRARQGINSLGANRVFFFNEKPELEEELLFPLLKSSDIHRWASEPSKWCLLPYDKGKLINPEILEKDFPQTWNYLLSHKDFLKARRSRFAQKNWYGLFGIGDYTFAPYRVTWRALGAKKMQAALVEKGIANQAMHGYIPVTDKAEGFYLTALLNSNLMNEEISQHNRPGSKSFGQPGVIAELPLPPFDSKFSTHREISRRAEGLHHSFDKKSEEDLDSLIRNWLFSFVIP